MQILEVCDWGAGRSGVWEGMAMQVPAMCSSMAEGEAVFLAYFYKNVDLVYKGIVFDSIDLQKPCPTYLPT